MEKNFVNKIDDKNFNFLRPSHQPAKKQISQRSKVFALTLSSNHAKRKNAYKAYKYVIKQLPSGDFFYTHEISKYGKFHIHGTMYFKYPFDYIGLCRAKQTLDGLEYDIHIDYKRIEDHKNVKGWLAYSEKNNLKERKYFKCDPGACDPMVTVPETCIPQVRKRVIEKRVTIPGICHKNDRFPHLGIKDYTRYLYRCQQRINNPMEELENYKNKLLEIPELLEHERLVDREQSWIQPQILLQ